MKRILSLLLLVPMLINAQHSAEKGIQWTTGLSWEQVKKKAAAEKKYIFLDCFTTWCGPCKMMDNQVFPDASVGNYFNDHFISVKVQMDKTNKDDEQIKSWYDDASSIGRKYQIEGYPTFVFLSPQGEIVEKGMGFKAAGDFIAMAKAATKPGKVYDDPYAEYNRFKKKYEQGDKAYDVYPAMIKLAFKQNDTTMGYGLMRELTNYVINLPKDQKYTRDRVELWAGFALSSKKPIFRFFYKDGALIDQVMNEKGYAGKVIDNTVQREVVDSFFKMQKGETTTIMGNKMKNSDIMSTHLPVRVDGKITPDEVEADWKSLEKMIRKQFNKEAAKRAVLTARIRWYGQHQNQKATSKYYLQQLNQYPPVIKPGGIADQINGAAWRAFLYTSDKKVLNGFAKWMGKVLEYKPDVAPWLDTYASLLYKAGRTQEAIQWQEKACNLATGDKSMQVTLQQMKKGEPIYVNKGAIWE